jgi:propionyl-CoA carboxylase alpha chain
MRGHEFEIGEEYVVVKLDADGKHQHQPAKVREFAAKSGSAVVETNGRTYEICSSWHLGAPRMRGTVDGKSFMAQVERGANKNPLALRVQHNGTRLDAMVLTPRTAELFALMPFKAPPDMSRFLLSPMPGPAGGRGRAAGPEGAGRRTLAVIEAMKMENVLFASADGVVGKVLAAKGESLAVDQPIVEFE